MKTEIKRNDLTIFTTTSGIVNDSSFMVSGLSHDQMMQGFKATRIIHNGVSYKIKESSAWIESRKIVMVFKIFKA